MKTDNLTTRMRKISLILIGLVILTIIASMVYLWIVLPKDILTKNLSMEEAQDLVSFPLCIPTYLPANAGGDPQIIYQADAANVPEETFIRLRYDYNDTKKKDFRNLPKIYELFRITK